ncbi:MAG: hypothetical protein RIG84_04210, partial [Roseovarius sp.]
CLVHRWALSTPMPRLTYWPDLTQTLQMMSACFCERLLEMLLILTVAAGLSAIAAPAAAHSGGSHDIGLSVSADATQQHGETSQSCCHKSGTCIAPLLAQTSPAVAFVDISRRLILPMEPLLADATSSSTDPPPPRP